MGIIISIGGGEIGRPSYPLETLEIDEKIVNYSGKEKPSLCFLPTATNDSDIYIKAINNLYGKKLNCNVKSILVTKVQYSNKELSEIIMNSDIIYVGGGNASLMMKMWKKSGLNDILINAYTSGKILSGLSAGAMCWFEFGVSDSIINDGLKKELGLLKCIGIIRGILCPHYDQDNNRNEFFKIMLHENIDIGIGIDNCAALAVKEDTFEVICSRENAYVYKVYGQSGEIKESKYENGYRGSIEELRTT